MPFKEIKEYGKELNKPIDEFQKIDAIEYYTPKEVVPPPAEAVKVPEQSAQVNDINRVDESGAPKSNKLDQSQQRDNAKSELKNNNNNNNNNNNGNSNNLNTSTSNNNVNNNLNRVDNEVTSNLNAVETAEGAAGSTTSAVVSSSAALTGGVTILVAAAAVAATVGSNIMLDKPNVTLNSLEAGADYLVYDMDITELKEGVSYKIKVSCGSDLVIEYPVTQDGNQKQIVTGLIPFRAYSVGVFADAGTFGDTRVFSQDVYTSKLKKPQAVFEFNPKIDYELGLYDLEYRTYISDYYNTGSNTYLKIYADDQLIIEDHEMPEDNFFTGVLSGLDNGVKISAEAFTTYYNEEVSIGKFGYTTVYPDELATPKFKSEFNLTKENVSASYDATARKYLIDIDTEFDNTDHPADKYRLDLYSYGELVESITTTDPKTSFEVPCYINNVDIKLTEISAGVDINTVEIPYLIEPKLFNSEFRVFEKGSYFLSITPNLDTINIIANGTVFSDSNFSEELTEFNYKITKYNKDGTSTVTTEENVCDYEVEQDVLDDNFDYMIVEIYSTSNELIGKYKFQEEDIGLELGDFEVTEDGNILIPYKLDASSVYLDYSTTYFDGAACTDDSEREQYSEEGKYVLNYISANQITGSILVVCQSRSGTELEIQIPIETINLNAQINTDTYVYYESSMLYGEVKFETSIDGQLVNASLGIMYAEMQYDGETDTSSEVYVGLDTSEYSEGMFYKFEPIEIIDSQTDKVTEMYFKYKINAEGFDQTGVENRVDFDFSLLEDFANKTGDTFDFTINNKSNSFSESYVDYVKTTNSDGTVNYYIYTGFEETGTGHSQRLFYSYTDADGTVHCENTDYFTGNYYALENVEDLDYSFTTIAFYELNGLKYQCLTRKCIELIPDNFVDIKKATITTDERNNQAVINVSFDGDAIDENSMYIKFNGTDYKIDYYTRDDDGTVTIEDVVEQYFQRVIGYKYTISETGYSYTLQYVNNVISITLNVDGQGSYTPTSDTVPTLRLTSKVSMVETIGADNIKNATELDLGEFYYNPYEYYATYDADNLSYDISAGDEGMDIMVYFADGFESKDSRDQQKLYIYDNDTQELLFEGSLIQYASYPYSRTDNFSPAHKNLLFKVYEIKETIEGDENSVIEYNLIGTKVFNVDELYASSGIPLDVMTNVSIQNDGASGYTVTGSIEDTTDAYTVNNEYTYIVYSYLYQGTTLLATDTFNVTDTTFTLTSTEDTTNATKIKVVLMKLKNSEYYNWCEYEETLQ